MGYIFHCSRFWGNSLDLVTLLSSLGGARGYDRSYGSDPEDMVSESEDMTGTMGGGLEPEDIVSEPEDMTGVMGWSQRS